MCRNPVLVAWIAGGLIWGAALAGLLVMGEPASMDEIRSAAGRTPSVDHIDPADFERALGGHSQDGDGQGDMGGVVRPVSRPDS